MLKQKPAGRSRNFFPAKSYASAGVCVMAENAGGRRPVDKTSNSMGQAQAVFIAHSPTLRRVINSGIRMQQGFTLIEVMLVVVILGVLATLVIPNMIGQDDQARRTAAAVDIRSVAMSLDNYRLDNYNYPSTDQGLNALIAKPSGFPEAKNWRNKYLRKLPKDPWGNEYVYISPGADGDFDLISLGRDGKAGGEGDDSDISFAEL